MNPVACTQILLDAGKCVAPGVVQSVTLEQMALFLVAGTALGWCFWGVIFWMWDASHKKPAPSPELLEQIAARDRQLKQARREALTTNPEIAPYLPHDNS